jgi:DNA-binding transcriptional ArsR family regulator
MKTIYTCESDVLKTYSQKIKVCGHPVRLKILCFIKTGAPCVKEMWECLDQPQPVISQHLAVLKENGVVCSEIDGNKRIYKIVDPFVDHMLTLIAECLNDEAAKKEKK